MRARSGVWRGVKHARVRPLFERRHRACGHCGVYSHGARASGSKRRSRSRSRTGRHDPALPGQPFSHGSNPARGDVRDDPGQTVAARAIRAFSCLDSTGFGHSGGALVRMAVFPARLGFDSQSQPQHVHAYRYRSRHGISLQRGCDAGARNIPRFISRSWRGGRRLFRGRLGHYGSRPARASPRVACAEQDERAGDEPAGDHRALIGEVEQHHVAGLAGQRFPGGGGDSLAS